MEMKIKQTMVLLSVCMMVFMALSAVMVYAPQPDGINTPFQNVVIVNDPDNPVPVNITDASIDVTLDETIEVTNPEDESLNVNVTNTADDPIPVTGTVDIDDNEILEVEGTVNIGNTEGLPLDLSNWLHTTSVEKIFVGRIEPHSGADYEFEIEGYREVTLYFNGASDVSVVIRMLISVGLFDSLYENVDIFNDGIPGHVSFTYPVTAPKLAISFYNSNDNPEDNIVFGVYLTT